MAVSYEGALWSQKTKLLDHMRNVMRLKHMSLRTEEAYVSWVKRFILFHEKRHPAEMGADEIRAFLTCAGHVHALGGWKSLCQPDGGEG